MEIDKKQYKVLVKQIDKLIRKIERTKTYNLSSSAALESFSPRTREKLAKKNEKAVQKREEYTSLIADILTLMKNSGYSIDEIIQKYNPNTIKVVMFQREELKQHFINPEDKENIGEQPTQSGEQSDLRGRIKVDVKTNSESPTTKPDQENPQDLGEQEV